MADLIKRIVLAVNNFLFGWVKEGISPSTPLEREEIATSMESTSTNIFTTIVNHVRDMVASPKAMTPEDSLAEKDFFDGTAHKEYWLSGGVGAVTESFSLGQVESVSNMFVKISDIHGIPEMMSLRTKLPFEVAVLTPYKYYLQSKFLPMIPGISDQVRFAVREAYPGVALELIPKEMEKWIGYLGYSKFWSDSYWKAHWLIPTLEQARELYWRTVITKDDYIRMLRLSDYSPDFNPYWMELAWRYPGRIDQRWLYEWGVIDLDQLEKFVAAEGIHPDWQRAVAETYAKNILRDEIGRVQTVLITMFKEGFREEDQLRTELSYLGWRDEVVEMNILEAKLKREYDEKTEYVKIYETQLTKGKITEEDFIASCRGMGLSDDSIVRKLELIKAKAKA